MNRRQLLRLSGAAIGGGATVATGARLAAEPADAQAELALEIGGDSTTLADGDSIAALWLDVDVDWQYDLPDAASPETVTIDVFAAEEGADREQVATTDRAELFTEAEGTESFEVDLIGDGPLTAEGLTPAEGSAETTIAVEARLSVRGGDQLLARASAEDTATVTVERAIDAEEYGQVGGSGELRLEVE